MGTELEYISVMMGTQTKRTCPRQPDFVSHNFILILSF